MNRLLKLQNTIQPYAWGSHSAIAELLGKPVPSSNPQAELWMGAHPKAPSKVYLQGRWQSLDELIHQDPVSFLGQKVVDRFGPQLPFLFKVLAVEEPLSIQAHPSKEMAQKGFARENEHGIALTAPHRNYRDPQHKPECVCALTLFYALCGFRAPEQIRAMLTPLWPSQRLSELDILKGIGQRGAIRPFFVYLMTMGHADREALVAQLVSAAQSHQEQNSAYEWLVRLNERYPGDVGVLSPILLNLVVLLPGQALFLPAGRLHAYLNGLAIEVMANSDNVLRGGLTPKHVDVEELLQVLDFEPNPLQVLAPRSLGTDALVYPSLVDEFELAVMHMVSNQSYVSGKRCPTPEILLCTDGAVHVQWEGSSKGLDLQKGESALVPASVGRYEIHGQATLYKAGVNTKQIV